MIDNFRFVREHEAIKCNGCGEPVTAGHLVNEFSRDPALGIKYYCMECIDRRAQYYPKDFLTFVWRRKK